MKASQFLQHQFCEFCQCTSSQNTTVISYNIHYEYFYFIFVYVDHIVLRIVLICVEENLYTYINFPATKLVVLVTNTFWEVELEVFWFKLTRTFNARLPYVFVAATCSKVVLVNHESHDLCALIRKLGSTGYVRTNAVFLSVVLKSTRIFRIF